MQLISREYTVAIAKRTNTDIRKLDFITVPNSNKFWAADPFPLEVDGKLFIFAEIFEYRKDKGSIGYTKYENGIFSPWKIIIEEEYHMSFPNVFYENDTLYMCPEACASKQLYLYKCIDFPEKWVKDKVLIDGVNYSDTIFYKKDNSLFAFTSDWNSVDDNEFKIIKLCQNGSTVSNGKIKTIENYLTRPAGRIITNQETGKEIMVSQGCKPLYGSGLIFKEFNLSWPDYSEHELYRIYPENIKCNTKKEYVGIHTFNITDHYVVIDLIWNRFSFSEKWQHLLKYLKIAAIGNILQ